jgi:hypothetical protein
VKRFTPFALAGLLLGAAVPAVAADDQAVIDEVLAILKDRGIVDDARYNELVAKNEAYEKQQTSLLSKVVWTGDFRARLEGFWYDEDETGSDPDNRNRVRYRFRIGAALPVNEWLTAGFRLASGESDPRSTNRSLGVGLDFDRDVIAIDEAYLQLKLPIDFGSAAFVVGKTQSPYQWKMGKDYLLWDPDLNPEGVTLKWTMKPSESLDLFANTGYYFVNEQSERNDPHFFALQGGGQWAPFEHWALGARVGWFDYGSIDDTFHTRAAALGNVALADNAGDFDLVEFSAYARAAYSERWPLLLHGHFAQNLDAESIGGAGKQDTGWGLALEVGDPKQVGLLGVGYYSLEADFAPALYIDSDLTDGVTNREGWTFYGARQVLPNTELSLTLFLSDAIKEGAPFAVSVAGSERIRMQTDVVVKF